MDQNKQLAQTLPYVKMSNGNRIHKISRIVNKRDANIQIDRRAPFCDISICLQRGKKKKEEEGTNEQPNR